MSEEEKIRERLTAWADGEGYCGGYGHDAEEGFAADLRFLLGLLERAREQIAALEAARRMDGSRTGTSTIIRSPMDGESDGSTLFIPRGTVLIDADTAPIIERQHPDEETAFADEKSLMRHARDRWTVVTVTGRATITTARSGALRHSPTTDA